MQTPDPSSPRATIVLVALLAALGGALLGSHIAPSGTSGSISVKEESASVKVAHDLTPAVVSITGTTTQTGIDFLGLPTSQQSQSAGTGFIVRSDGLIVTNKHVIAGADALKVQVSDGREYDAKVAAEDPTNDLALLKIDAHGLTIATLGTTTSLQVGSHVLAFGNALGHYEGTVTEGVVSAIGRAIVAGDSQGSGAESLNDVLQTDAAINPGNSGGPLVDLSGRVIGINVAVDQQGTGIGFALPIEVARSGVSSYEKTGRIKRPLLGVRFVPLTATLAASRHLSVSSGALIQSSGQDPAIVPDSPADRAGLREGDVITKVDASSVDQHHPLTSLVQAHQPGDLVAITYLRGGKAQTAHLRLAEAPAG